MEQVVLDMIPTGAKAVCHVSQYDLGRTIRFNLRSGGAVYTLSGTETIKVYIKKPDGTTTERNIANTSSTYVDWVTGEGDCDQAGNCECELVITSGTTVIGSKNFTVKIEEDPYNDQGVVTETAGPAIIATFTTNVVDLLQEVKCEINAKQDLHGYDHPWPAGGGKNQLNYNEWKKSGFIRASGVWENNGVTITATENDGYTQYNAPVFTAQVAVSAGESIWLSWEESTNKDGQIYLFTSRNGQFGARTNVNNAYAKSLHYVVTAEDEGYISFRFGVTNQGETISYKNIQIEKGSAATPYEPYENVCPISGFTEMDIIRSGVNIWNEEWKIITQSGRNWITNKNPIPVQPNHTYYISTPFNASIDNVSATGSYISYIGQKGNEAFTTPSNCHYIRFLIDTGNYGTTYNNDISINYPSTDTAYHPAEIIEKTIQLGQTVYRARINITTGQGIIDMAGVTDLSQLDWTKYDVGGNNLYRSEELNIKKTGTQYDLPDLLCSAYPVVRQSERRNMTMSMPTNSNHVDIINNNYSNASDFKASLAGKQMAYEIATPVTIQLTPEQIEALLGVNNVWHDGNGDTEVKYLYNA